jgi:hypothetical protein
MATEIVLSRFLPPEVQLENLRKLGHERPWTYAWRLTEADFREAEAKMPRGSDYGLSETTVIQLVPYLAAADGLDAVRRTFRDLWHLARFEYPEYHCDVLVDRHDNFKGLKLIEGIGHRPGLRWETIDLEANLLAKPAEVRNARSSPHAGIMAIAAFQPEAFKRVEHTILLPGYELETVLDFDFRLKGDPEPEDEIKGSVLCLSYDRGDPGLNLFSQSLGLDADETVKKSPNFNWVVPVFV